MGKSYQMPVNDLRPLICLQDAADGVRSFLLGLATVIETVGLV